VTTSDGRIAFTSNTGSDEISAYGIDALGKITLLKGGMSASTGRGPADLALAPDDRFLFVVNLKGRTLGAYAVGVGGKLDRLNPAPRLPNHALGLVAL
jgi:6-phosphogluconolactonase (cycloisomerase 2 family)